jgi:outer membrane protein TolC
MINIKNQYLATAFSSFMSFFVKVFGFKYLQINNMEPVMTAAHTFVKRSSIKATAILFCYCSAALAAPVTLEEAISRTLSQHSAIKISQSQVQGALADVQTTEGQFDVGLSGQIGLSNTDSASFDSTTFQESEISKREQSYEIDISKQFENSVTVSLANSVGTSRTHLSPLHTVGISEWALTVSVPLLRGFGREATTYTKRAAEKTLAATQYSSAYDITKLVYSAVTAYWTSLGIQENYKNLKTTMQRANSTAQTLEERQKGGELTIFDYQRSLAELRLREVDLEEGRQRKYQGQETFAVAIGNTLTNDLPEAVGTFPEPADAETLALLSPDRLFSLAIERRFDLKAQKHIIQAAIVNWKKRKDDTQPTLDLSVSTGYTAAQDNFSASDTFDLYLREKERNGPNLGVYLTFRYPLGNNTALGAASSSRQGVVQTELQLEQLIRNVRNEVNVAIDKLKAAMRRYKLAAQSLALMENVAADTMRQLNLGEATLTDMISVEDRLTQGRLRKINALSSYAQALAELRFVTGTLSQGTEKNLSFNGAMFSNLPLYEMQSIEK